MPISNSGVFIIGDISNEQSLRHWTTTSVGVGSRWVGGWMSTTVVGAVSINSSLGVETIEAGGTKFQIISKDTSWIGGGSVNWVVGNLGTFGVIDDLSDSKTHRVFISVEEGQIVVINLVGKQDFVFIEDGWSTIGWSLVSSIDVIT